MRHGSDSMVACMTIGRTRAFEFGGGEIRDQLQMGIGGYKKSDTEVSLCLGNHGEE